MAQAEYHKEAEPWALDEVIAEGGDTPTLDPSPAKQGRGGYKIAEGIRVNEALTLGGIPAEVVDYRPGNRSALE